MNYEITDSMRGNVVRFLGAFSDKIEAAGQAFDERRDVDGCTIVAELDAELAQVEDDNTRDFIWRTVNALIHSKKDD